MKSRAFLTILLLARFLPAISQPANSVKVDINHVFFCVDSITYNNLFKDDFIAKIFADTRELSNKTLTDSWTGKYLFGRDSYIEVFAPNSKKTNPELGDKFGDVGIVFKTKLLGDIHKINLSMKADNRDTHLKTNESEFDGKIIAFNYNLFLSDSDLQESFCPYVEEKTADFLKFCGFNESEIKSEITAEQFREKMRHKKFDKLYDNIERIELTLTHREFEYLAETLKYFGFSRTGHRFTNKRLEIICSIQQNRKYKLKAIHFTLLNKTEDIKIEVSKNLTFIATGARASFEFNFQ